MPRDVEPLGGRMAPAALNRGKGSRNHRVPFPCQWVDADPWHRRCRSCPGIVEMDPADADHLELYAAPELRRRRQNAVIHGGDEWSNRR